MEARASSRYIRLSPQKARLVADTIRGKGVEDALVILDLSPKRFARALAKLVRSALANAQEKNSRDKAGIDVDNLVVGTIHVDQGPSMWSVHERAQGRANWVQKRTASVRVELSEE